MFSITLQTILLTCFLIYIIPGKSQVCLTFIDPCPTSWHLWGNSCYIITETIVPWASARGECTKLGGALVAPRTVQENDFIGALIPAGKNAWIDCVLDGSDVWVCKDDGEEVQLRNWDLGWSPRQPDEGRQRCAVIQREWSFQYLWHDHCCNIDQRSACKKPAGPRYIFDE
ncbi:C-type lectin domain family 4 member A-like [Asterias rubens]|uniref:C-type lectin domain family 4 member A-like n=1 Tax=Asterias rubens TaxID=7604 RepID=UPI001455189E|nr:C-type lectin domain family 4 member A-like [Asterias rubens]